MAMQDENAGKSAAKDLARGVEENADERENKLLDFAQEAAKHALNPFEMLEDAFEYGAELVKDVWDDHFGDREDKEEKTEDKEVLEEKEEKTEDKELNTGTDHDKEMEDLKAENEELKRENAELTKEKLASMITDYLDELTKQVLAEIDVILITLGGETSYKCCHAINSKVLKLEDEVAPAISLTADENSRLIVTKSGNLGNTKTLIDILDYLKCHEEQIGE